MNITSMFAKIPDKVSDKGYKIKTPALKKAGKKIITQCDVVETVGIEPMTS